MDDFYVNKKVLITGGAGFIGHNLLNRLIQLGAKTTVADNLSTGDIDNVIKIWEDNRLKYKKTYSGYKTDDGHSFIKVDLKEVKDTLKVIKGQEIVFHLAANFGGRGFIDTHPADCCENFSINQNVISAASRFSVKRLLLASTACVYPFDLQKNYGSTYLLKEKDAFDNNWANADREYGWAKLMGELILKAYRSQYGLKGSITRYVTAYGPGENDTHAIIALIRRAVEKEDPYIIWGSGQQDRDFTYVDDIVSGTLAACEYITDCETINLGTSKRYKLIEIAEMIFDLVNWRPKKIIFDKNKPEGVKTRALDIKKAKRLLNWQPKFSIEEGLRKTINWYVKERPKSVETIK